MSEIGIVQYLTINGTSYQNHWIGQTVSGRVFLPFVCSGFLASATSGQSGLTVTLPLTTESVGWLENGLAGAWLVSVELATFPVGTTTATVVTAFYGEVVGGSIQTPQVMIEVGNSLDAVSAQTPPRKYTTTLVGTPPRY
jgi:hypothetical protein